MMLLLLYKHCYGTQWTRGTGGQHW